MVASTLMGSVRKEVALMKRIIMLSALAAAMAVMLALAGSASADNIPPDRQRFVDDEEQTDVFADCGDFEVRSDFTVEGAITTFYDSSGNPDYYKMHLIFHDFFYSTENPDEGFAETNVVSLVSLDASGDTELKVSGLQYHVTIPGEGLVLVGAGTLRFDTETGEVVFEGGPHSLESDDTDKVCAAFDELE